MPSDGVESSKRTHRFQFTCDNCGDALETHEEQGFFIHGEYHSCFGEKVRGVALVDETGVNITREGISFTVVPDE